MASAFPIAIYVNDSLSGATTGAKPSSDTGSDIVGPLPFGPVPPAADAAGSTSSSPGATEGPSSLPGSVPDQPLATPGRTGSPLLDQIVGAARVMGYDVTPPALPLDKLPAVNPLRPAILAWVLATGSQVPASELSTQLARADALPQPLQRDLALVVLSAAQASLLQQAALAKLSPAEVAWVYAHPELADQLVRGIDTPETRTLAAMAGAVDMKQSIEASLLVIEAVEATKGDLANLGLQQATKGIPVIADDPTTSAMLRLLASAGGVTDDAEKIQLAARIVALGAHLPEPTAPAAVTSFSAALDRLVKASSLAPDPQGLATALERADALPADLRTALATTIVAEANAIDASNPQFYTPAGRTQALVDVLMATAAAMPTLEKYSIAWRDVPSALRTGQWDPASTHGYALEQAALLKLAHGDPTALAQAGGILHGAGYVDASVPQRTFVDAFVALATEAGHAPSASDRAQAQQTADALAPATRDAAAIMMSGAAESARYHRLAMAALTSDEQAWLDSQTLGLDQVYQQVHPSAADLARLARATQLAEKVDIKALTASEVVAVSATQQAKDLLTHAAGYQSATADARPAPTFWDRVLSLLPIGSARAQASVDCVPLPVGDRSTGNSVFLFESDCASDVQLRIVEFSFVGGNADCDTTFCYFHGNDVNNELLLITGQRATTIEAQAGTRERCKVDRAFPNFPDFSTCIIQDVPRSGAATVSIDLGGSDVYRRQVAVVGPNAMLPVSLHLDVGGDDTYSDLAGLYDAHDPTAEALGVDAGMPTEGSAIYSGVAVLLDAQGGDVYQAKTHAQAYGRFGLGMLADLGGGDRYVGLNFTQGATSETYNLGLGILLDAQGDDRYVSTAGQGYGVGGMLLDLGGTDAYVDPHAPMGAPIAHLDIIPGGNVTTLDQRGNDHFWLDGPSNVNLGLAVDEEARTAAPEPSSTGLALFAAQIQDREGAVVADADGDTFPDFIEHAFGTDANNADSHPVGFPRGPVIATPIEDTAVNNEDNTLVDKTPQATPRGGDKIIDLRVPVQDIGSLDSACVGTVVFNGSVTDGVPFHLVDASQGNIEPTRTVTTLGPNPCTGASATFQQGAQGSGTLAPPNDPKSGGFTFHLPTGILAVGDSVATRYDVDYLVMIDIGGNDLIQSIAGGAVPLTLLPPPNGDPAKTSNAFVSVNQSFLAPSLAINVDPAGLAQQTVVDPGADCGCDVYDTSNQSYTQGALYGVLVDTGGNDVYRAKNVSQGAVGGVLLDLGGLDRYTGGNLSQGASLAGFGTSQSSSAKLPNGDGQVPTKDAAVRRTVPGLLLDFAAQGERCGSDARTGQRLACNTFIAGGNSQGFARGFPLVGGASATTPAGCTTGKSVTPAGEGSCQTGPDAMGILLSASSDDDVYNTVTTAGVNSQGVGGGRGIGALLDLGGDDRYFAYGQTSHGAALGGAYAPSASASASNTNSSEIGAGLLIDAAGSDTYSYFDPIARNYVGRGERENHLNVERADDPERVPNGGAHVYDDIGLHLDTNATVAGASDGALLASIMGSNRTDTSGSTGFFVDMPSARLALGSGDPTDYSGHDYALIIDLGGENNYTNTGGGFVPDALAGTSPPSAATVAPCTTLASQSPAACQRSTIALFPVSLLFDAGHDASLHATNRSLGQGAGFFSVGIVVDAGGQDVYTAAGTQLPAFGSQWMQRPLAPDGVVHFGPDAEWNVTPMDLNLTSLQDSRYQLPFHVAVTNDERNLYVAVEGPTHSDPGSGPGQAFAVNQSDNLTIDINPGAFRQGYDNALARTGLLRIRLSFDTIGNCVVTQDAYDPTNLAAGHMTRLTSKALTDVSKIDARCRVADGRFSAEVKRSLRESIETAAEKRLDLVYDFDTAGFHTCTPDGATSACTPALYQDRDLALRLAFHEAGTANDFAYPAGTTDMDGDFVGDSQPNGKLDDEMAGWALVRLANAFNDSNTPTASIGPQLSQGAAVAGVGILANLGAASSSSTLVAGDRSQAYADFQGLALLMDGGGSDVYSSGVSSQGSAAHSGFALFVDAGGNDRYLAGAGSNGLVTGGPAVVPPNPQAPPQAFASFLDLGGSDQYTLRHPSTEVVRLDPNAPASVPGNDRVWSETAGGFGADVAIEDTVQSQLASALASALYGGHSRTQVFVTRWDPVLAAQRSENLSYVAERGCTSEPVPTNQTTGDPILNATVCLRAIVTLNGAQSNPTAASHTAIDSVDFTLDGYVVGTALNADPSAHAVVLDSVFDTTKLGAGDGVLELRAHTAISADLTPADGALAPTNGAPTGGAIVFYDPAPSQGADLSFARVMVSNPPTIALALDPTFTGVANAVVSTRAAATGKDQLHVTYNVSHDADEGRLDAVMGYSSDAIPAYTNLPCKANQTRLCNVLPFFLPADGGKLTTTPGQRLTPIVQVQQAGSIPYSANLSALGTPLTIAATDSFHVYLAKHTPILPEGTYHTRVRITLERLDEHGAWVSNTTGQANQPVYLADQTFDSIQSSVGSLGCTVGAACSAFETVRNAVNTEAKALPATNVPYVVRDLLQAEMCSFATLCDTYHGYLTGRNALLDVCKDEFAPLGNTPHSVSSNTTVLCDGPNAPANAIPPQLTSLGGTQANATSGALATVSSTVNSTLSNSNASNWTEFFLDFNASAAAAAHLGVSADGYTLPPGYGFMFEVFEERDGTADAVPQTVNPEIDTAFFTVEAQLNQIGLVSVNLPLGALSTAAPTAHDTSESLSDFTIPLSLLGRNDVRTSVSGTAAFQLEQGHQGLVATVKNLANNPVPIAYFFAGTPDGDANDFTKESRLDVRVPTEPSTFTTVTVYDARHNAVRLLQGEKPIEGTVDGGARNSTLYVQGHALYDASDLSKPAFTTRFLGWHGENDNGNPLPDGVYTVEVSARDTSGHLTVRNDTVLLDSTPPLTTITTSRFVGKPILGDARIIPLTWNTTELRSGLKNTRIYQFGDYPTSQLSDATKWSLVGTFSPAVTGVDIAPKGSSATAYVMAISQDQAGNIESACPSGSGCPTDTEAGFLAARVNMLHTGLDSPHGYVSITEDKDAPEAGTATDAIASLGATGVVERTFLGGASDFVRAGAQIALRLCARDVGTPDGNVKTVLFSLDHVEENGSVRSYSFTGQMDGRGASCPVGFTKWSYSGWGDVNTNKTLYPDGIWTASADVYDRAGNRQTVTFPHIVLDSEAPTVAAQAPVYPTGQSAVKPGDNLTLRLLATDAFLVDEPGIVFHVGALSRNDTLPASVGRDGNVFYQEVRFQVDKAGLVDNQVYTVTATVKDLAGNAATATFSIPVSFQSFTFTGTPTVVSVSYDRVTLSWNTSVPTTAYIRFGPTAEQLSDGPRNTTLTTTHVVTLSHLTPATRYVLRPASTTAGGLTVVADPLEIKTPTGLYLEGISPVPNSDGTPKAMSGAVPLRFHGGVYGSADLVRYTLSVIPAPGAPESFVTTLTEGGDEHTLTFNSSRYLDGTQYALHLTAEAGPDANHLDTATLTLGPFLLDNTPPDVDVVGPLVATRDARPTIVANAQDNLAGFAAAPAQLYVDGKLVADKVPVSTQADGVQVSYALPADLAEGTHTFDLRIADKAGNVAEETWKVAVDNDPPDVGVNPTAFAPGTAAAKAGGSVTLNLSITDASGIALATADTSGFSTLASTRLVRIAGTDFFVGTAPVTLQSASATVPVRVSATDLAGNTRNLTLSVPVDNTPPVIGDPYTTDVGYRSATIHLDASEPVLLVANATAPGSPPASAATTTLRADPRVVMDGLLPSRTYAFTVTAIDAAGNVATRSGSLATLVDSVPPTWPNNQAPQIGVVDLLNGTLRLSWIPADDDVGVAFYRIYRSDDGSSFHPVGETTATTFDSGGLTLEKRYSFQVVAVDYGANEGKASLTLSATATAAPRLSAGLATPTLGSTATTFRYVVTYMSPGGVAPTYVHILLDGVAQNMTRVEGGSLTAGAIYAYETKLAPHKRDEPHTYSFEASDGRHAVKFPEDGSRIRGPLVTTDTADTGATGLANFAQRVPLGGAALVTIAGVAAVAITALAMRKKKEGSK